MKKNYLILVFLLVFSGLSLIGQSGQYLHLDRANKDYVLLDGASQYIADAEAFAMTGWFYTDALEYGQGMMGPRGASAGFYLIQLDNGIIECRYQSNGTLYEYVAPAFSVVAEQWQHFAWVYTGSKVQLYIDGTLKGESNAAGTFGDANVGFAIGRSILSNLDFYFGGRVDEISLWSKALSEEEIQDMIDNEIDATSEGLEVYYKCNQGVPGEDNTTITKLISEVGDGERDADLYNFALTGETSNFGGELDLGFQAITFEPLANKLTTDAPFDIGAIASSALPVSFEIVSGPATIDGNTVTLTGEAGEVSVKASQGGDATFDPAEDLTAKFQVLDPVTFTPTIEARSPLQGTIIVPELSAIQLAAIADIGFPELFNVKEVIFEIDGESVLAKDWGNNHYTSWWTPADYGFYTINIQAKNNYDAVATSTVNIEVVASANDVMTEAIVEEVLNVSIPSAIVEAELPCYLGAYDQIIGTLDIQCPAGGCDEWDRVASIDVKGHNGKWIEIIRYITPYGVACEHSIDLTDYMSLLQGKVAFRINYVTFGNGFEYNLRLDYQEGTPTYKYSTVDAMWQDTYDFGNMSNLQPTETLNFQYSEDAVASTLKLVSTGHGWGDNNTGNAAEFHEDTHHIWVNGVETFEQHNWEMCNPNPDGCQPQAGEWFHDRAGWCPGAIAKWFDFDMTDYIGGDAIELRYVFDEDYVDLCNVNNPDCVTNASCDCEDSFNPHLIVASNLVTFANIPLEEVTDAPVGIESQSLQDKSFHLYPNPTKDFVHLDIYSYFNKLTINVLNNQGQVVLSLDKKNVMAGEQQKINLKALPKGLYLVEILTEEGKSTSKLVVE